MAQKKIFIAFGNRQCCWSQYLPPEISGNRRNWKKVRRITVPVPSSKALRYPLSTSRGMAGRFYRTSV